MRVSICTTSAFLERYIDDFPGIEIRQDSPKTGLKGTIGWLWRNRRATILHVDTDMRILTHLGVFGISYLLRPKLLVQDLILCNPSGFRDQVRSILLRRTLRRAAAVVLHQTDFSGLSAHFGLSADQVTTIPFKVNEWAEALAPGPVSEGDGFGVCLGQTFRDFPTFLKAYALLRDIECTWLQPSERALLDHGAVSTTETPPQNVRIIYSDGSRAQFLSVLKRSSYVVLPIPENTLTAAGISTVLDAMWFGKPVIIARCPAVSGMFPPDCIITYKAGDATELAAAVRRVHTDETLRRRLIRAAKSHLLEVRGEKRLAHDILHIASALAADQN